MAFKLGIELIPETTWYKNLRNSVPKDVWDRIRSDCYKTAGHKCEVCISPGKLNCHEVWEFDIKRNIQRLKKFIALCDLCHNIKHIGLVNVKVSRGELSKNYYDTLVAHFMKVNGASKEDFDRHCSEAYCLWELRSKKRWKLDFGTFLAAYKPGQQKLF